MRFGKYFRYKPHLVLFVLAIFIFLIAYLFSFFCGDSTLDINVHDTYYVISHDHVMILLAIWISLCGLGYWILFKWGVKPILWMTLIHIIVSLIAVSIITLNLSFSEPEDVPRRYYENSTFSDGLQVLWGILLFLVAQATYFINILLSTIIARRNQK